jgi:hypothetical protein
MKTWVMTVNKGANQRYKAGAPSQNQRLFIFATCRRPLPGLELMRLDQNSRDKTSEYR